jgi:undecaprenyl-diphosphatase
MVLAAALLLAILVVLAFAVWHVEGPTALDRTPHLLHPPLAHRRGLFRGMVWLGSPVFVGAAAGLLFLVATARRDWFAASLCIIGPGVAGALTEMVAKPLIDRQSREALSFPSGHTTGAAAIAILAILLAYRQGGPRLAAAVALPAACLPAAVSLGVVHLGWHYATDAVGGMALGGAAVLLTAVVLSGLPWPPRGPGPQRA